MPTNRFVFLAKARSEGKMQDGGIEMQLMFLVSLHLL